MNNNPLSYTDPSGHSRLSRWVSRATSQAKEQVARSTSSVLQRTGNIPYVGGLANVGLLNTQFGYAYGWSTGDWRTVGRAHVQGAVISGTMWLGAEYGATGRMFGSGINGYLQAGNSEGFLRGFASGGIPQDLGFTDAYNTSPWANIGIGIGRDATRGYIVGGREGIVPGIGYGQFNNAVGHLVGFTTSGFSGPTFSQGAFIYDRKYFVDTGAITFGNVISGDSRFLSLPLPGVPGKTFLDHEMAHIPQSSYLGALYMPVHGLVLSVSSLLPGGHHGPYNPLECSPTFISVPAGSSCF